MHWPRLTCSKATWGQHLLHRTAYNVSISTEILLDGIPSGHKTPQVLSIPPGFGLTFPAGVPLLSAVKLGQWDRPAFLLNGTAENRKYHVNIMCQCHKGKRHGIELFQFDSILLRHMNTCMFSVSIYLYLYI